MASIDPAYYTDLYKSTAYCFQVMEETLERGDKIDEGFIEIFNNDLEELRHSDLSKRKITNLTGRFERISGTLFEVSEFYENLSDEDKNIGRKLMGNLTPLSSLAEKYPDESKTGIGLSIIAHDYNFRKIAGDGHCLFRSAGASLLDYLKEAGEEERKAILDKLLETVRDLDDDNLTEEHQRFLALIDFIINEAYTVEEIMQTPDSSDLIVQFFRRLVTEYNKIHANEVFESEAKLAFGSVEGYNSKMVDMKERVMGGNAEIDALARSLNVDIHILNPFQIGNGQDPDADHQHFGESRALPTLSLLYRRNPLGHYDLLVPTN